MYYNQKLIFSGMYIEHYKYEKALRRDFEQKRGQVPFSITYSPLFVRLKWSYGKKAVLTTERTENIK